MSIFLKNNPDLKGPKRKRERVNDNERGVRRKGNKNLSNILMRFLTNIQDHIRASRSAFYRFRFNLLNLHLQCSLASKVNLQEILDT